VTSPSPINAAASGTWRLGDLTVHRIGFGAMRLTGSTPFGGTPSDRARSIEVLHRTRALGVNHVDTAAFYFSASRSANELINTALAPYPDDLLIATKVGPSRGTAGDWLPRSGTPEELRGQVEENLRQLGRDHLDLVYLRVGTGTPVAEQFGALAGLRDAGLIRHLGVSGVTLAELDAALAVAPVVSVQNRYGLGLPDPGSAAVLRACGERGIAFVPFFAIAGAGRQSGVTGPASDAVRAVAARHGATPAQVRLAWSLHQGPHVLAIPGTGDPDHVSANVAAGALSLSPAELAAIEDPSPQ
jgi:aryl-alcohol dehydrogenase-like predicted oxidoreductase